MKPENKLPVLDLISAEMKTVVNTLQPDLPPGPQRERLLSNDSITRLSADSGMRALQKWQPKLTWFQQNMGRWKHVSLSAAR